MFYLFDMCLLVCVCESVCLRTFCLKYLYEHRFDITKCYYVVSACKRFLFVCKQMYVSCKPNMLFIFAIAHLNSYFQNWFIAMWGMVARRRRAESALEETVARRRRALG
jgi:hypothetical protein